MNREQIEQEVIQLVDTWATAEFQGHTAFLEKLLADDFVGVGLLGFPAEQAGVARAASEW